MIHCLFRYSTDAEFIKLMWRFKPLLLRMHGEISHSLLHSHSSWGSALGLAPPLHVGCPLTSFLRPDRKGLKERLIWGLWLTQPGGRERYGMWGEPAAAEASMTLHQPEAPCVVPGKLSLDHRTLAVAGCTCSQEGRCG